MARARLPHPRSFCPDALIPSLLPSFPPSSPPRCATAIYRSRALSTTTYCISTFTYDTFVLDAINDEDIAIPQVFVPNIDPNDPPTVDVAESFGDSV
ncbi:hypothetical protein ONZ45_g14301 [Pleurotus djamor]|nr:hypothetical protein ONZ45_g14301 [Pleurotus djamor]